MSTMKLTKQAENFYKLLIDKCKWINSCIDEGYILLDENNEVHKGKFIFHWMGNEGIFFAVSKHMAFGMLHNHNSYSVYGKNTYYQECKQCYKNLSKYKLINPEHAISVI